MKTEKHLFISLTFKKKDNSGSITIFVGARSFGPGELYSGSPGIFGGLLEVSGFGQAMGEVIGEYRPGSLLIASPRTSLTWAKRIYDLTDDHVLINQPVTGYLFQKKPGELGSSGDVEIDFTGTVDDWSINPSSGNIEISVGPKKLSTKTINARYIEQEDYTESGVDVFIIQSSFNRPAPIVFGAAVQVKGEPRSYTYFTLTDSIYYEFFGVATIWQDLDFTINQVLGTAFTQDFEGVYREISLETANSFVEATDSLSGSLPAAPSANVAIPINIDPTGIALGWISLEINGQNNGGLAVDGDVKLILGIGKQDETNGILEFTPIPGAVAHFLKEGALATQIKAAGDSSIAYMSFEKSVVLRPLKSGERYYVVKQETASTNPTSTKQFEINIGGSNDHSYVQYTQTAGDPFQELTAVLYDASNPRQLSLAGYRINSSAPLAIDNGKIQLIRMNRFPTITGYPGASVAFTETPPFERQYIFTIDGLKDDSSGTITGSADQLFESAFDIIKFLYYMQNGQSLTGWDTSRFPTAASLAPNLGGAEESAVTYRDLIIDILENASSKLIPNRNGSFSYWVYGVRQEAVALLTEANSRILDIRSAGLDNIINSFKVEFNKKIVPYDGQENAGNYYNNSLTGTDATSIAVYGEEKTLEDSFSKKKWINNTAAAELYRESMLAWRRFERKIFTVETDLWFENFRKIEVWDLVEMSHVDNPSKSGSAPTGIAKNLYHPDANNADWFKGWPVRHAKRFTFRVLKREPIYTIGGEHKLRLELLALDDSSEIY